MFFTKKIKLSLLISLGLIGACATNTRDKPFDYETPGAGSLSDRLIIPPDITGISSQNKYELPTGAIRATEYNASLPAEQSAVDHSTGVDGAHIERAGKQRWLVIDNQSPQELWAGLRNFWQKMGFVLAKEEPTIGFMETQWAENRANIPGDVVRDFLTRIGLGSVYSSALRDKFIIHVEAKGQRGSLISFTNQRREEVFTSSDRSSTKWVSRPADTNLEAQFLARYMMSLGLDKNTVAEKLKNAEEHWLATLNHKSLFLKGSNHSRNYYRLKLALERIGLSILDASRTNVLVVSPALDETSSKTKKRLFSQLLNHKKSSEQSGLRKKLYVMIQTNHNGDNVSVRNDKGQIDSQTKAILARLYEELR